MKLTSFASLLFALLAATSGAQTTPGVVRPPTQTVSPPPTATPVAVTPISVPVSVTPISNPVVPTPISTPVTPVPISNPEPVVPISAPTSPPTVTAVAAATGETSILLDVGNGIRAVAPSRVTVPVGEALRITGPNTSGGNVQWFKDGAPLRDATSNPLILGFVTTADAGTYTMSTTTATGTSIPSQGLVLGVGPTDRLFNLSTRATVGGAVDQAFVAGFVAGGGTREKKLILRAVGPALAQFGVTNPLRRPVLEVFDAAGKPYQNSYVYAAVVGGLTYETDLADSLAKAGAFPTPAGSADAVLMMPFKPGAYSARVTSGDGSVGTVLLEIYEVP